MQHFHMHLSQKQKIFSEIFFAFSKFTFLFQLFRKKMTLIADVFLNLRTLNNVVTQIPKKSRFRGTCEK